MFDFEKLIVYQKSKSFNKAVYSIVCLDKTIDKVIVNQLKRAALSVPLNIAEGTSRYSKADRRHFYVIARGSLFECIAIFDILKDANQFKEDAHASFYEKADEISRILFAMIKNLN